QLAQQREAPDQQLRPRRRSSGPRSGGGRILSLARNGWVRAALVGSAAVGVAALLWWRGPAWGAVANAFTTVQWNWVAAAVGLNLLSVVVRALAWRTVIVNAFERPHPPFMLVLSAFSVGLFANAVL